MRLRGQPEHAGLPILLLTALDRPEDKARGLEAGANDFLSKPFDESELAARLRSLLRTKALQDRLADLLGRYVSESVAAEVLRDPFGGLARRRSAAGLDPLRRRARLHRDGRRAPARDDAGPAQPLPDGRQRRGRDSTAAPSPTSSATASSPSSVRPSSTPTTPSGPSGPRSRMQDEVMRLQIPTLPGVRLHLGIGITTGEVIAGNVGSERRMHYTVVGDPVNVASRLQTAAGPGQILVDERTHEHVAGLVASQDLGSLRLAGKSDWVRAFNVLALQPALP